MKTIDEIVLSYDKRGISSFQHLLPRKNYLSAAEALLSTKGPILICTGLVVDDKPETDGPPGAVMLGRGLRKLERRVVLVIDEIARSIFIPGQSADFEIEVFPISDMQSSMEFAAGIMQYYQPGAVIAVERCGVTKDGTYLNMRGEDITAQTAKMDFLFHHHRLSIGIGDGGNEIGMGNIHRQISASPLLVKIPTITQADHLLPASVSNWGAYGLLAAMSAVRNINLLPDCEALEAFISEIVSLGAIDGVLQKPVVGVDGFDLEVSLAILERLQAAVDKGEFS